MAGPKGVNMLFSTRGSERVDRACFHRERSLERDSHSWVAERGGVEYVERGGEGRGREGSCSWASFRV
jgi:hypothetical protein